MHWIVSLLDDADGDCVWHWYEFVSQLGVACFFKVFLLWFCLIRIEARLVRARLVFRPSPQKALTQARAEKVRFFCAPVFGLTLLGCIKPTKNLYQKSIPQLYDELEPSNHGQVSQHVTTTNLSYRFPFFETSATALCGTTGIIIHELQSKAAKLGVDSCYQPSIQRHHSEVTLNLFIYISTGFNRKLPRKESNKYMLYIWGDLGPRMTETRV